MHTIQVRDFTELTNIVQVRIVSAFFEYLILYYFTEVIHKKLTMAYLAGQII